MSTPCCNTTEILSRWLDGDLDPVATAAMDLHVETCVDCQQTLEKLTHCRIPRRPVMPLSDGLQKLAQSPELELQSGHAASPNTPVEPEGDERTGSKPRIPGYDIIRLLGRGGMGRVYLARQTALERLVAIKVLSSNCGPESRSVTRLKTEARALAAVSHRNIVKVYDVVDAEGLPAIVLEYIADGSLSDYCRTHRLSPAEAARLTEEIARGIHAAHQAGIVHRDLKPSNILLDAGIPRVADFGLAMDERTSVRTTVTGEVFGTPEYMAPEQIQQGAQACSPQSDVYSTGAILYELLTGNPPFAGDTIFQTMQAITGVSPLPPKEHNPEVPDDLSRICLRALRKLPEERFATALDLAVALASADLTSGTGTAGRRSASGNSAHAGKAADRRHTHSPVPRTLLAVAAGVCFLIVGIVGLPLWSKLADVWRRADPTDRSVSSVAGRPGTTAPESDRFVEGSHWQGTFAFLPAADDRIDGDMELLVEKRSGDHFSGVYSSEQKKFSWNVVGDIAGDNVRWEFVSAIRDNDHHDVVGRVEVQGTVEGNRLTAIWKQGDETARLRFELSQRASGH